MILSGDFWINLRDFFVDKFTNIKFGDILLLLIGIIFGIIVFALIYLISVLSSFRRREPAIYKNTETVEDEEIKALIDNAAKSFKENNYSKPAGEKMISLKETSVGLIENIARKYYPNSPHPVSELSIDEIILLSKYITERVDYLLSAKLIKPFRKYRVSKVLSILDTKKKVEESKVVKAAKKAKLPKIAQVGWTVAHVLNPVFWFKKLIFTPTFSVALNKMGDMIIKIVGEETAKIYSKNIFKDDSELSKLMNELDEMYEE